MKLAHAAGCGGVPTAYAGLAKLEATYWLNKAIFETSIPSAPSNFHRR